MSFSLLFIPKIFFNTILASKFIPKFIICVLNQGQRPKKAPQRPKRQLALGGWIFSEFDYRHIEELKSKFWCTIDHHLVLFQNWLNLLHKIAISATLEQIFEQKPNSDTKTIGSTRLHIPNKVFLANNPNFLVGIPMTKAWAYVR